MEQKHPFVSFLLVLGIVAITAGGLIYVKQRITLPSSTIPLREDNPVRSSLALYISPSSRHRVKG